MKSPLGKKRWAIAEGYIPAWSHAPEDAKHELTSHEAICILNLGNEKAQVGITVFFKDRPPIGPYHFEIEAERTLHLRMNELDPEKLKPAMGYSSLVESNVPVVVQHTRLDSRQAANSIMTTIAYSE